MIDRLVPIAMGLGLVVSPDTLVMAGQTAGAAGSVLPLVLLAAMLVHLITLRYHGRLFAGMPHSAAEMAFLRGGALQWFFCFPLVARTATAIIVATGVLVSAGFVFNEVFLYWFPNFAFAFILLGFVGLINMAAPKAARLVQPFLTGGVLLGLAVLSLGGTLFAEGLQDAVPADLTFLNADRAFIPLLLFVGVDLAVINGRQTAGKRPVGFAAVGAALAGSAVMFTFWGLASMRQVPLERLADTTIPHIIAAREIFGQPGRLLMGGMVIAGSCAAVNALFSSVAAMTAAMADCGMTPSWTRKPWISAGILSAGTAVMMAGGMAGEESLEALLRACLILWLGNYGLLHLALISKMPPPLDKGGKMADNIVHVCMLALFAAAGFVLSVTHSQPQPLLTFLGGVGGGALLLGYLGSRGRIP